VENRRLVKLIQNYIRDSSGVFSVSSPVRILMTSFPALTLLFVQNTRLHNKKKITRWLEDMNFYFLAALICKILFLPLENKIHIFAPPCNILYLLFNKLSLCPISPDLANMAYGLVSLVSGDILHNFTG